MQTLVTIGLIREGKVPPDSRVPLTPKQCAFIMRHFPVKILVEPSPIRCYKDAEYLAEGIEMSHDMTQCDVLMGVKEVPIDQLIPNKTYLFFSHTIKKQAYNRKLLQAVIAKNIRLLDYEVLTDDEHRRLIAFGKFAGMVGAHNGLYTYAKRTGLFDLPRMKDLHDYAEALDIYENLKLPSMNIVLTGTGRVAEGSAEVLRDMGMFQVSPEDYLGKSYTEAVFTQLDSRHYVQRKDRQPFHKQDFYEHPDQFESAFEPYTRVSDIFINGIFWNNSAPAFFTLADMRKPYFRIKVIADVTCDIAPASSVPSTLRASTIADPIYGYHPFTESECPPFQPDSIDVMAIDNLPNELPRDASAFFGDQFIKNVLDPFLEGKDNPVIIRATITCDGALTEQFGYLEDYVKER